MCLVPKGYGGGYNIRVHGDKGALFLDFEINRERLLVRTNDGKEINEEAKPGLVLTHTLLNIQ